MLHGSCFLADDEAGTCLYLAHKLGTTDLTADEEREIQCNLKHMLKLEQGVPTALGSGKQLLKYKIRAVASPIKLTSSTWKAVAHQLNNTAIWVGDLGETGVTKVKTNLKDVVGSWIERADGAEGDDADDFANVVQGSRA